MPEAPETSSERPIVPARSRLDLRLTVPGSKSLTQRALVAAALAEGESLLRDPLDSEDTRLLRSALRMLGADIDDRDAARWRVRGRGGRFRAPNAPIFLGNNGTATRFLASLAALADGTVHITGDARMGERPIAPLLDALSGWGVDIASDAGTGCPPLTVRGGGLRGGAAELAAGKSSQYLSSLLLVAPYARETAEIRLSGALYSRPYVAMTLEVMRAFGARAEADADFRRFTVPPGAYRARDFAVEGDASGASYFLAAAAMCGGRVRVENLPSPSLQGDAGFAALLGRMGCRVDVGGPGVLVEGPPAHLAPIDADMADMPDAAPTLAVVAAFAQGESVIRNIAHLRVKECDRVGAMARELRRLGVEVREEEDALFIRGRGGEGLSGARIRTYNDHRVAMSLALAGLRVPGVVIENPGCVGKSFPDFWERFRLLEGAA